MRIKPLQWVGIVLISVAAIVYLAGRLQPSNTPAAADASQDVWRWGTLQLHTCEIGGGRQGTLQAHCTEFAVHENHADSNSRLIKLRVAVLRSEAAQPDASVVTFLDGGPGGAATEDFPAVANAFEPLRKRHHILLIDQRGTGGSNALECQQLASTSDYQADELGQLTIDKSRLPGLLRSCLQEVSQRADPQFYSTTDAMQDLEAVRVALGNPALNLIGVSYGTRVAQQYAIRYPHAVRSIVLDSPVPNTLALGQDHARNLDAALKAQFAVCQAQAACAERFPDSFRQLMSLRNQLQTEPVSVQVPDPRSFAMAERKLTATGLSGLVRLYAYNSATSALLPLMLDEATRGNYAPLLGQEQLMNEDINERLTGGMGLSVGCTEDADLLQLRSDDAQTLLGNALIEFFQNACKVWPHRARPANFHEPFKSSVPVLLLSGELDPVTPPHYAEQIQATLSNARLLRAPGQGHTVMNIGCMPQLINEFVDMLQPGALDADCLQQLKPMPTFLHYNGAAP